LDRGGIGGAWVAVGLEHGGEEGAQWGVGDTVEAAAVGGVLAEDLERGLHDGDQSVYSESVKKPLRKLRPSQKGRAVARPSPAT
jgi:hypothetical protein